jgi:regulator of sigma E protease
MTIGWYALWFIVAVSLLVTVHEYGHFWVARRLGFKVLRFSIGFGKPLFKRVVGKDRTEFVIAAIPLGGYVKMLDEREGPVAPEELSRSFTRKPPWQRILVLLAGPAFNIVFAILVLWGMLWSQGVIQEVKPVVGDVVASSVADNAGLHSGDEILSIDGTPVVGQRDVLFTLLDVLSANGTAAVSVRAEGASARTVTLSVPTLEERRRLTEPSAFFDRLGFRFWQPPIPPVVTSVRPGSPGERAGLRSGDRIVEIEGRPIKDFRDITAASGSRKPGDELTIRYERAGAVESVRLALAADDSSGRTVAVIGLNRPTNITYPESMKVETQLTPLSALTRATQEAWDMTVLQARLVWRMVLGQVSLKNLSGPLSIAEFAGESANDGVASFLGFLVLISLSLGFLNLLPIPILDGGQIVFQLVEWLKGSPVSDRAQAFGQQVGIALLLLLMGVALYNDILHQIQVN